MKLFSSVIVILLFFSLTAHADLWERVKKSKQSLKQRYKNVTRHCTQHIIRVSFSVRKKEQVENDCFLTVREILFENLPTVCPLYDLDELLDENKKQVVVINKQCDSLGFYGKNKDNLAGVLMTISGSTIYFQTDAFRDATPLFKTKDEWRD